MSTRGTRLFTSAVLQGLNAVGEMSMCVNTSKRQPPASYEVAEWVGATEHAMRHTLYKLSKAGIVTTVRGRDGGFRITEEQLRSKRVKDVLEALGHRVEAPQGRRASDRLQQMLHDACDVTLEELLR